MVTRSKQVTLLTSSPGDTNRHRTERHSVTNAMARRSVTCLDHVTVVQYHQEPPHYITSQLFQLSSDQISLQSIELVYSDSSGGFLLPTFVLRYEVTPVSP